MFFSQVTQNKVIILQNTPPPPLAATNDSRYLQSIAADAWKTHIWRSRFEHFLGEDSQTAGTRGTRREGWLQPPFPNSWIRHCTCIVLLTDKNFIGAVLLSAVTTVMQQAFKNSLLTKNCSPMSFILFLQHFFLWIHPKLSHMLEICNNIQD